MMLNTYSRFIVRHSYVILFSVSAISTILTAIPLIFHELPSFSNPVSGFETRGTTLANRFIAWYNLIEETRPSRLLAANPQDIQDEIRMNQTNLKLAHISKHKKNKHKKNNRSKKNFNHTSIHKENIKNYSNVNDPTTWSFGTNVYYEDEDAAFMKNHTRQQWATIKDLDRGPYQYPKFKNYVSNKCGPPMINYAHLVVTHADAESLLSYENIKNMCQLQSQLIAVDHKIYHRLCERLTGSKELCCPQWSIPNYIALMSGREYCENITREDVENSVSILQRCSAYFHNFTLTSSCDTDHCNVPKYCSQYNAVYNILFYLIDSEAFSPNDYSKKYVKSAMIFIPLARSTRIMPYYNKLIGAQVEEQGLVVSAIDFGLKNALFDLWVVQDIWLVGLGGCFVLLCVWCYTRSLLLTILLFTAITYSLGIAYFLYVYVFNLDFFPFMNLLVIVVVIGIGADDAFLYVKVWRMMGKQMLRENTATLDENYLGDIKNLSTASEAILVQVLQDTLRHTVLTILVTTVTTAVAFFASIVSYIPAINCFSLFAGTAVLVNFFLMVTLLPISVFLIDIKLCFTFKCKTLNILCQTMAPLFRDAKAMASRFVSISVVQFHYVNVFVLGGIGIYSIVVVFYKPSLQLPTTKDFQLFRMSHPFEQYDLHYRHNFLFERLSKDIETGPNMPIRWVWGITDIDNGNHMEPESRGHLKLSKTFSVSDPHSQVWLLQFCAKLKYQSFYQPIPGPLLPNCFIETFKTYMSRRCIDPIDKQDRSPCCEASFPYEKDLFEYCIVKGVEYLYRTSRQFFMPGVAGPKFLKTTPPKVAAIVVEFESVVPYSMSYTEMDRFFSAVENWTRFELESAPSGLKDGWFVSDLQFYDLQNTLASGTMIALLLSGGMALLILLPATYNLVTSICALTSIVFSATVTIGILVLSDWKLNVLESVAISTSAGLAVDFSLHYALAYTNAKGAKYMRVKHALCAAAGPTAAAALTSGSSGIFLIGSNLLPYSQIGTFLALIMAVSWIYATFFLSSLLCIFGKSTHDLSPTSDRKSISHVSSVCSGIPGLDSHELENLADSNRTNISQTHSPSSISDSTVVLHDDCFTHDKEPKANCDVLAPKDSTPTECVELLE